MSTTTTTKAAKPRPRRLKIEAEGGRWKGRAKPKIRLIGKWLQQAGFVSGHHVEVICVAPGVMQLRSTEAPRS